MIEIKGRLINDRADQTRVYEVSQKNLRLDVCYSYDDGYVRSCDALDAPGVYILLWSPSARTGIRDIYIGQTSNLARRFSEHKSKRDFECACMFSSLSGRLTKTETLYLEFEAIVSALEYGSVNLLENYQIPTMPEIEREDMIRMDEFFDCMRVMMSYCGFGHIFEKKYFALRDASDSTVMLKRLAEAANERPRMNKLFDEGEIDDELSEMVSYETKGDGYKAVCIPFNKEQGNYFIMPKSTVSPYVSLEHLASDVEASTRSLPRGMVVDSLSSAAEIITGRADASVWIMNRTII